jgi:uncharacterized protein YidB (DUF937 family)
VDFSEFHGKMTWDERYALIQRRFPSSASLRGKDPGRANDANSEWKRAFDNDVDLAGRILKEVLRAEQATPGRLGPRLALDAAQARPQVDEWLGNDPRRPYTTLPFKEALANLAGKRSINSLAIKVGMNRAQVQRLMKGEITPSGEMMEAVAKAFEKRPSYFLEYRVGAIAAHIMHCLTEGGDNNSVRYYEAMFA